MEDHVSSDHKSPPEIGSSGKSNQTSGKSSSLVHFSVSEDSNEELIKSDNELNKKTDDSKSDDELNKKTDDSKSDDELDKKTDEEFNKSNTDNKISDDLNTERKILDLRTEQLRQ